MLKLYPLYSGSSGNMYIIKSPNSTLVVDIGVSFRKLVTSLENLNMNISDISALLITHEHSDHIKGLSNLINKTNIPVYMTKGTYNYIISKNNDCFKEKLNYHEVIPETSFKLSDIETTPFSVSHDATSPVGYSINSGKSSLTIATDLGYVSDNVYTHLKNSNFNIIEANYDRNLLLMGPYTYPLKCRIQSNIGHLSNDDTANTILDLAKLGKRDFLLGHISENNNEPEEALFKVTSLLKTNGFNLDEFNINCATRDVSFEVYDL